MIATIFVRLLIAQHLVAAVAYAVQRDWARCGYWLGAAMIVTSTLYMR